MERKMSQIINIALTGSPCGGKTSALPIISNYFKERGWQVYIISEVATMFHSMGVDLLQKVKTTPYDLEFAIFRTQMAIEDSMTHLAKSNEKTIILCDRGLADLKAYISEDQWKALIGGYHITEDAIYRRYDCVIHLTTAAIGAEKFFNNDNPARNCSPELAKELDGKTLKAWSPHFNHTIIKNEDINFEQKIRKTISKIEEVINQKSYAR
jgi:AAA domain